MAETLKKRRTERTGRLLVCLLLAAVLLSQMAVTASGDYGLRGLNTSGNRNVEPSVDPIENSEGFSAVLYNNSNGLPTSDANAIVQTAEGFLWIGSYAGLIRYDGIDFERIGSTEGIANVRCLYVDSRDRLWIGTNDSGVFLLTGDSFRHWDRKDGLRSVSIRTIAEDGAGVIYIGSAAGGLAVIDAALELSVSEDGRFDGRTVLSLRQGTDGLVYGYTQEGDLFTVKNGEAVSFLGHDQCRIKGIRCLVPDPGHPGRLYIGTEQSEVCYGDIASNFANMKVTDISPLSYVNSLELIGGKLWICAANGAGRLDGESFNVLENVPMNNSVEHVMTDFEGNLWFVSSHQGVMKIVRNRFSDLFEKYGLTEAVVNTTCLDGETLFIGTDTGLIVIEGDKKADSFPLTSAATASGKELEADDLLEYLDGVRIRSVFRDSKGRLWISTWRRHGLLRYDRGGLTAFTAEDGLISDAVRTVVECEDGSILVANTGGVSVIRGDRVTASYGEADGIVNGAILTVAEGFGHEPVLGSDGDGIYVIGPDGTRHIGTEDGLLSEIVLRVKRSRTQDVIWIVTGNSLAYMTPDYRVTTVRQFPYPNNYDLYENSQGDVWVLSSAGIYVASAEDLLDNGPVETVFFGIQSGLPYVASANAYSELTDDGELYIASSEGVVKVNIETPFENIGEIRAALPFIDADGERIFPNEAGKFVLPAGAQKVTLYPCVFNYSLIDPQVSYRLTGLDAADTTVSRSKLAPVDYTNLKIGTYEFVMTVKDTIGHTEQTATFQIVKGKEMSFGTIGTIILNAVSLLLMAGILAYTSVYRKRGRPEDKLFLGMILTNMALAVGELLSYLLEYTTVPFTRELMIAGNTIFYMALTFFSYLLLVYIDYTIDPDAERVRKTKLLYGIPCFLIFVVMLINLKTGWIFSIGEGNVYQSGLEDMTFLPVMPVWFYLLFSLFKVLWVNKQLGILGGSLILVRIALEIWARDISSTAFFFTLFLVILHLYVMNRPLYEEVA